jgi:hypothetical protein
MPHSMASIREKSHIVQGNRVPSTYPEPLRKNGVADRFTTRRISSFRFTASRPLIHSRAVSGVTHQSLGLGIRRHLSTSLRTALISAVWSYFC